MENQITNSSLDKTKVQQVFPKYSARTRIMRKKKKSHDKTVFWAEENRL